MSRRRRHKAFLCEQSWSAADPLQVMIKPARGTEQVLPHHLSELTDQVWRLCVCVCVSPFITLLRCKIRRKKCFYPFFFGLLKQQDNQTLAWLSTQLRFRGFSDAFTACWNFGHQCQWATKLPRGKSVVSWSCGSVTWAARPLRCLSNDERALLQHFRPLLHQPAVAGSVSHRKETRWVLWSTKSANRSVEVFFFLFFLIS